MAVPRVAVEWVAVAHVAATRVPVERVVADDTVASVAQARLEGARVLLSARTYPDIVQSEMCRDDTAPAGYEHRSSGL